jgi:uncharacterized membrane protein YkvA (DUF1232 family)
VSLRISFDLSDEDLRHFQLIMQQARQTASHMPPEDIVAAAEELLKSVEETTAPGFIVDRLRNLKTMTRMLSDLEWRLPHQEAKRVLSALAYFAEPEDLIPDLIPGLGFLDDAIMIELVVRELKPEIDAYEDFCTYRDRIRHDQGEKATASREAWLNSRRKELQSRMRRRRTRRVSAPFSGKAR